MSSVEEAEAEEQEVDSFFTQAEATELVWKFLSAKALGMDKIHTQYFKSECEFCLDCLGLHASAVCWGQCLWTGTLG